MKYKFIPVLDKRNRNLELKLLNFQRGIIWFIQCDTNIWWIPKHIYKRKEQGLFYSWGWLFTQVGFMKFFEGKNIV